MKPNVIFFSRSYQAKLFPQMTSSKYNSIHVTLTKSERKYINKNGVDCKYSFEEYKKTTALPDCSHYLETSFFSDRFLNKYSIKERKLFLAKEIAFWSEIFEKYKPIAVVNELVAIEISEVMYIEAKKRGIVYKAWIPNPINGYFYWLSNPMSIILDSKIFEVKPSSHSLEIAQQYFDAININNKRPYYIELFLNQKKIKNIIGSFSGYFKTYVSEIIQYLSKKELTYISNKKSSRNSLARSINVLLHKYNDLNEINKYEVIFYPLHYEPEASIIYLSEYFSNQIALIENLSKCIGYNQILVIKEHPAQPGMLLTKKFRELRNNISNVYYLPHKIISYDVIKVSKLIITLSSHLGWEALILGKPVYILGKMFYYSYPYVNRYESFEKLREDIKFNRFIFPKKDATIRFIAQLFEYSHKGKPLPGEGIFSKNNIQNLVNALEKEIELLGN